jgi:hypothetical protein
MASSRTTSSVGLSLEVGIFVLTVATAVIHLYLAFTAIASMGARSRLLHRRAGGLFTPGFA